MTVLGLLLFSAWISYAFYGDLLPALLCLPAYPFYRKHLCREKAKERQRKLALRFRDTLELLRSMLRTGKSMENAILRAEEILAESDDGGGDMKAELENMRRAFSLMENTEDLWADFGRRSGRREILSFGEILASTHRSSGRVLRVMESSIRQISAHLDMEEEIRTLLHGKSQELKLLLLLPPGLLIGLRFLDGSFLQSLYTGPAGRIYMTLMLLLYLLAAILGQKITGFYKEDVSCKSS